MSLVWGFCHAGVFEWRVHGSMESPDSSHRIRDQLEVWEDGASRPMLFPLLGERTLVGSGDQAHVVLTHPSVAPLHAQLVRTAFGRFRIQDLSGEGGVTVCGSKVADRLLEAGEDVRIGNFTLRIRKRSSAEYRFVLPASTHGVTLARRDADPKINGEHLASLMRLGRTLVKTGSGRARMQVVCECLVAPPYSGTCASVLRIRPNVGVEVLRGATASGAPDELGVPTALIERLVETRGPTMEVNDDVVVMACPLTLEEDYVDALFVSFPLERAKDEWLSLVALAAESHQQAELVWEMRTHARESARVERELEMAREIQEGLIPRALQFDGVVRGVDIAVGFDACRWVAGDYVDAVPLQDGRILLAVADVCGKGMQAAMVASAVHTAIHVIAGYTTSMPELMERINLHLCNYLPSHSFVTMVCAALDLAAGSLEYASAGHPPAMIVQPGGTIDLLDHGDNPPLGMMDTRVVARTTTLAVGETLLLYTDGLTEMKNVHHQPLGMAQLAEILSDILVRNPEATARETQIELIAALHAFRGNNPATDDSTFLVARRHGGGLSPNN